MQGVSQSLGSTVSKSMNPHLEHDSRFSLDVWIVSHKMNKYIIICAEIDSRHE